jgi:4-alpha-glucanotransferase
VIPWRDKLLDRAFQQFKVKKTPEAYDEFVASHSSWLDDFVLFNVIKSKHPEGAWNCWEPRLRDRERAALIEIAQKFPEEMNREKFRQFVFYRQWSRLKDYCNKKGISIIGDIPIYMRFDSADVWANQSFFILDVKKNPKVVSGVPPDYFSKTGQLWGHPVYNWNVLRKNNFDWWVKRVRHNLELFDLARLDHFRGFAGFWTVPAKEKTAVRGKWLKAPGEQLFRRLLQAVPSLPIIAEDLGVITDDVIEIMQKFGFPGMKILLFSFGSDFPKSFHIPHNLQQNCVLYTGTHDNNTAKGWFEHEAKQEERERVFSYLGRKVTAQEISFELTRLAFMSVATTVIIPMQDLLGLGQDARMNVPATIEGNWQWQLKSGLVTKELTEKLLKLTVTYGRD